jgi:hypothetical protein
MPTACRTRGSESFVAAHVEPEALRARGAVVGQQLLDHAPVAHRLEIITRRPFLRAEALMQVEHLALKRGQRRRAVAEILDDHLVEIPAPDIHVEILAQ